MTPDELRARLTAALDPGCGPSSDFDLNHESTAPTRGPLRGAGVLVAIDPLDQSVILTKRAAHLSQHPGQISFPGGRLDPGDANATAAALREAHEEIGLPATAVEVLGCLPGHETVTGYAITPVLALVVRPFVVRPEPGEVAEVFRVPFAHVASPENYLVTSRHWRGTERRYYTVPYGPYYIWGATARILRGLAHRLTA